MPRVPFFAPMLCCLLAVAVVTVMVLGAMLGPCAQILAAHAVILPTPGVAVIPAVRVTPMAAMLPADADTDEGRRHTEGYLGGGAIPVRVPRIRGRGRQGGQTGQQGRAHAENYNLLLHTFPLSRCAPGGTACSTL